MNDSEFRRISRILTLTAGRSTVRIARISDVDSLLEELLTRNPDDDDVRDERLPYWAELWPSAIGLAKHIAEFPSLVNGKNVLEIGCGLALPGIVAGMNGGNVRLSDYSPDALNFARYNWKLNSEKPCSAQIVDWRNVADVPSAEIILASDIAYESRSFSTLIASMKKLLSKNGMLLLSEPNRKFASDFIAALKKHFTLIQSDYEIEFDSIRYVITVYEGLPR